MLWLIFEKQPCAATGYFALYHTNLCSVKVMSATLGSFFPRTHSKAMFINAMISDLNSFRVVNRDLLKACSPAVLYLGPGLRTRRLFMVL